LDSKLYDRRSVVKLLIAGVGLGALAFGSKAIINENKPAEKPNMSLSFKITAKPGKE
jgi:hypothetical protein